VLLEFEDGPLPGEAPPVGDGPTAVMILVAVPNPNELVEAPGPDVRSEGIQPEAPAPVGPTLRLILQSVQDRQAPQNRQASSRQQDSGFEERWLI